MSRDFCCDIRIAGSDFSVNNVKAWIYQAAGGGVMMWWIFSWTTLGPLVPTEYHLNSTAYLSIVSDHVIITVYSSSYGYFQQDNMPCHNDKIISNWFFEHYNGS